MLTAFSWHWNQGTASISSSDIHYTSSHIYLSSSSSSCHTASMDIPDPLSSLLYIVHRFWQVLRATSRILTELLDVGSNWSPSFCSGIWGGPYKNITHELVPASSAVSCMSGRIPAALWAVASRTSSKLLPPFLCSSRQAFSPSV